ncbi:DUF192 domain-containing protein [bacterium]|nr:DUF192 domain-containing protein [Actinomycetota bacterium]NDG29486.1 DUF192 domain-containing protein [bacterium]
MKINIAQTPEETVRGLMRQTNFHPLLFIFPKSDKYSMHMRNMKSNIDIFWITSTGIVRKIYRNVSPSEVNLYPSVYAVKYAIEAKPNALKLHEGMLLDMESIIRSRSIFE